ncbi:MAG: hypothetical protein R3B45_09765 [Bdellovibrionota bacterium]
MNSASNKKGHTATKGPLKLVPKLSETSEQQSEIKNLACQPPSSVAKPLLSLLTALTESIEKEVEILSSL